jgi:hypothetical protein
MQIFAVTTEKQNAKEEGPQANSILNFHHHPRRRSRCNHRSF